MKSSKPFEITAGKKDFGTQGTSKRASSVQFKAAAEFHQNVVPNSCGSQGKFALIL
jgi:hypothetical protein